MQSFSRKKVGKGNFLSHVSVAHIDNRKIQISGALLSLVSRNVEKFARVMDTIQDCGVQMEPLVILGNRDDARKIRASIFQSIHNMNFIFIA